MSHRRSRATQLALALVVIGLGAPATASAWEVKVYTKGAGLIDEVTPRNLMNCTTPLATPETTELTCVAGTPNGVYNHGDIVELHATVPAGYYTHGWRFSHWEDSENGGGRIDCDEGLAAHVCKFQIFENLWVRAFFTDDVAPDTSLGAGGPSAGGSTNQTSASFTFSSPDPSANFECQLSRPGGPAPTWATCGTPSDLGESYSGLTTNGAYTFRARAKDPSLNTDATEVSRTWTVDTVAPVAGISGGPAHNTTVSSTSATFTVSGGDGATGIRCALDGAPPAACSTSASYTGLAQGKHDLAVYSFDAAGNVGPTVVRTWFVDTVAPDTSALTGGPAEGSSTTETTAEVGFSSEAGATFECSLDDAAFATCTSPHAVAGLAPGAHTLRVRAVDAAGNRDQSPSSRAWTVIASDADGDGSLRSVDCDDNNATIRPGATDVPGNGVDEDCSGADAVKPVPITNPLVPVVPGPVVVAPPSLGALVASVALNSVPKGRGVRIGFLRVSNIPAGGVVSVRCRGGGCPFKARTYKPRKGVVLVPGRTFRRILARRATLEIRITAPNALGKVVRYKIGRKGAVGTTLCLPPGTSTPKRC